MSFLSIIAAIAILASLICIVLLACYNHGVLGIIARVILGMIFALCLVGEVCTVARAIYILFSSLNYS